jgi:hypothetical protein
VPSAIAFASGEAATCFSGVMLFGEKGVGTGADLGVTEMQARYGSAAVMYRHLPHFN